MSGLLENRAKILLLIWWLGVTSLHKYTIALMIKNGFLVW
jgi:hypothetical protein